MSDASWLGYKEIVEDWRLRDAVVVAEIISHDDDRSQIIVALNLPSGSVHLQNMALFCPVLLADARHVLRRLISWS